MIKLKELRRAYNKTLKDVAMEFETSPQVISRYELGQAEPDFNTLIKLADYFNVSVDYLLGRPESPTEPIDADLRHLTDTWHALSDIAKLRLLAYADGLKDND